ncbi:MAG TPA: NADH oxidase, partial [Agitococcus sp.]|nr:NADH oxidase [Agitococcus sp.]
LAIEPDIGNRLLAGEEPRYQVKPIKIGIGMVDKMALMEIVWYARQLHRMAKGNEPKPTESALTALMFSMTDNGWQTFKTRRLRA